MRGDVDELKGVMEKMMEMLHTLATKKDAPQSTMISKITGPSFEPQHPLRVNTMWLEFGLTPNYTTPFIDALGVEPLN